MASIDLGSTKTIQWSQYVPTMAQGVAVVSATTGLDAVSTVLGLWMSSDLVETNPLARAVFDEWGVFGGVLVVSLLAVLIVVAVTELGVQYAAARTDRPRRARAFVRYVGYGVPSIVSVVVSVHNVTLLAGLGPLL